MLDRHSIYAATSANYSVVIDAYGRSLRVTFILAIVAFVIVNALVFPIKLPNLKHRQQTIENGSGEDHDDND